MIKKRKTLLISSFCILLLNGCVTHFNNKFKYNIKNDVNNSKNINFFRYEKEKTNNHFFIDFSVNKDLSSALNALNSFNKDNVYILDKGQENIIFPNLTTNDSRKLNINSFYKLQKFIENTTNYIIKTKQNPFTKGLKQVIVINKEKIKHNIFNYPFQINGTMTIKNLLTQISKTTHYSIIFEDNNPQSFSLAPVTTQQNGKNGNTPPPPIAQIPTKIQFQQINFYGKTIGDFLNYLSNQFNYFVDIDYKNKLIIFKKYKTFTFNLILPDFSIQTNMSNANSNSNTSSATTQESKYAENIVTAIKTFIRNGNIQYKNGIIFAKITKKDFQTLSDFVKKINQSYMKTADIDVSIYIFALKKEINFGADLSFIKKDLSIITNYNSQSVITYNKTNTIDRKYNGNLNNSYLYFINKFSYHEKIINKLPITLKFNTVRDYIKSIETTTTTSTATTTATQTNIGQITEGQEISIIPNIYSDKIFLDIQFINENNDALIEKNVGGNTVMLPTNSTNYIPAKAILKYGEKRIVGIYQTFVRYDSVKGLLPTDIPVVSRVVGNNDVKYVRELIAVVVNVNKPDKIH